MNLILLQFNSYNLMSMLKSLLEDDVKMANQSAEMELTKISSKDNQNFDRTLRPYYSSVKKSRTYKIYSKKLTNNSCWKISATTMTRDGSPSFTIPKSPRFSSIDRDIKKNGKIVSLELRKGLERGVSFANSKRKNHWLGENANFPSSASYFKTPEDILAETNPEFQTINFSAKKNLSVNRPNTGATIPHCLKPEKQLLYHGRKKLHHPEQVKANPGVGKYTLIDDRTNSCSYTMRKLTKRFNEHDNQHPGPSSYAVYEPKPNSADSINIKGTFQRSQRLFLMNPDNLNPGPGSYMK